MIESLKNIDQYLFLFLNSFHNSTVDFVMLWISNSKSWIPFYVAILYFLFKKYTVRQASILIVLIIIAVGLSDFITSGLFKPFFERLRPCHEISLQNKMILVGNCGGKYGFASSHAANSFALALMCSSFFPKSKKYLLIWATIVSYSRIYLGVHYPFDVLCGAMVGFIISKSILISLSLKL